MSTDSNDYIDLSASRLFPQDQLEYPVELNYIANNQYGYSQGIFPMNSHPMNVQYVAVQPAMYVQYVPVHPIYVPAPVVQQNVVYVTQPIADERFGNMIPEENLHGYSPNPNLMTSRPAQYDQLEQTLTYELPAVPDSPSSGSESTSCAPCGNCLDYMPPLPKSSKIPEKGVRQPKYAHGSKQKKINKSMNRIREMFKDVLAEIGEKVHGDNTVSVNVKSFDDLSAIITVLNDINAHSPIERLALILTSKNARQKKGFVVYIRVAPEALEECIGLLRSRFDEASIRPRIATQV